MRTKVMKKRGRKITAILLAFAMVLPMAWSQTVVTEAAGTDSEYLKLELNKSKNGSSMELGDKITFDLKAAKAFTAHSISGDFTSFTLDTQANDGKADSDKKPAIDCFTIKEEDVSFSDSKNNWQYIYRDGRFEVTYTGTKADSSATTEFKAGETIASITFTVTRAIDTADVAYKLFAFNPIDADGNKHDEAGKTVTCNKVDNTSKDKRKVTFEMEQNVIARVNNSSISDSLIKVPVRIAENVGFNAVTMKFDYDNKKMTYEGYEMSAKTRSYFICRTEDDNNGELSLAFAGRDDAKITGEYITLKFSVKAAKVGDTTEVKGCFDEDNGIGADMYNESGKKISVPVFSTNIKFEKGFELGDVDMNGSVNLLDVTLTLQKYNQIRELTEEQQKLADVNKDGKVTLVDALLILKHVNGEIKLS